MFSPARTALYVAIGAMAFAAGEANAGCKYIPNPPGSLVCAAWIKGSEVCDITSSGDTPLLSATCSITGANFFDGAEGASGTSGAYCASGALPPGLCESASDLIVFSSTASTSKGKDKDKDKNKPKKPKKCKPKHHGKHDGWNNGNHNGWNGGNHNGWNGGNHFVGNHGSWDDTIHNHSGNDKDRDSCDDIIVPGDEVFLTEEASTPVCDETSPGVFECTASAVILPPEGSMCTDGQPAVDFTASAMLAVMEACVDGGEGQVCDFTYDYCTVDPNAPDGTPYTCVDISDQEDAFCGFSPLDPECGTPKTSCSD